MGGNDVSALLLQYKRINVDGSGGNDVSALILQSK
jgi:hypothetical protein